MGEKTRGLAMNFLSMLFSKNLSRILKKVAAVNRLSEPAWCCGPIRETYGRDSRRVSPIRSQRYWKPLTPRSSATSCSPPLSVLQLFIRYCSCRN